MNQWERGDERNGVNSRRTNERRSNLNNDARKRDRMLRFYMIKSNLG